MARTGSYRYDCPLGSRTSDSACPVAYNGPTGTDCALREISTYITFSRPMPADPTLVLSIIASDGCDTRVCGQGVGATGVEDRRGSKVVLGKWRLGLSLR